MKNYKEYLKSIEGNNYSEFNLWVYSFKKYFIRDFFVSFIAVIICCLGFIFVEEYFTYKPIEKQMLKTGKLIDYEYSRSGSSFSILTKDGDKVKYINVWPKSRVDANLGNEFEIYSYKSTFGLKNRISKLISDGHVLYLNDGKVNSGDIFLFSLVMSIGLFILVFVRVNLVKSFKKDLKLISGK